MLLDRVVECHSILPMARPFIGNHIGSAATLACGRHPKSYRYRAPTLVLIGKTDWHVSERHWRWSTRRGKLPDPGLV